LFDESRIGRRSDFSVGVFLKFVAHRRKKNFPRTSRAGRDFSLGTKIKSGCIAAAIFREIKSNGRKGR
jgi:hypothetical protein